MWQKHCYTCKLGLGLGRGADASVWLSTCRGPWSEPHEPSASLHLQPRAVCRLQTRHFLPSELHKGCSLRCCYSPCSLRNTGPAVILQQNRLSYFTLSAAGLLQSSPDIYSTQKSFEVCTQQHILALPFRLVTSTTVYCCCTTLPSAGTCDLYHCSLHGRRRLRARRHAVRSNQTADIEGYQDSSILRPCYSCFRC